MLPSLKYCLAPKMPKEKSGAACLRAQAVVADVSVVTKAPADLDRHAGIIFNWLNPEKTSRIRMLLRWQSVGGLTHVASVYQRVAQCFWLKGNSLHEGIPGDNITLQQFQESIRSRHEIGNSGIEGVGAGSVNDFTG